MKTLTIFVRISLLLILFAISAQESLIAQDIILNEIMFASTGQNNEFIEIYNTTDSVINLTDFKIKYYTSSADAIISTGDNYNLEPNKYAIIYEADYDFVNGIYNDVIPSNTLTFILDDNAFGSSGMANTSDRMVSLISALDDTVDVYTYSANNNKGISDERISHDQYIWENSRNENGTPGSKNSVTPVSYDLEISEFRSSTSFALLGESIEIETIIKNIGIESADSFWLNIYYGEDEVTPIHTESFLQLVTKDSIVHSVTFSDIKNGINDFTAKVEFLKDENIINNSSNLSVKGIEINEVSGDIVINEIMYAPKSPEPEWIEIYNNSEKEINLRNYKVADNSDTNVIVTNYTSILPNQYFVFADDSSIYISYPELQNVIVGNLPTLNNSSDKIILMDSLSRVIDSLSYSSAWGGKDSTSLERINVDNFSEDMENWSESIYPTPGKVNSVTQKDYDLAIDSVFSIPQYPLVGTKTLIIANIKNVGKKSSLFGIKLFEDLDGDNNPDNLLEQTQQITIQSEESIDITLDTELLVTETSKNYIVKVAAQDDDITNNTYYFTLTPSFPLSSILVNEIMYSPINLEPEWIEFYNNSEYNIDLAGWSISDVLTNPVNKTIPESIIISPLSYFVITKSNSIYDFHKTLTSQLILLPFANLNNDEDGVVIRDGNDRTIDSLKFSNNWGGTNGKSLERINFNHNSINEYNWKSSLDFEGSTPGRINSTTPKNYDLAITSLEVSPAFPIEGDDINLHAKIYNYGNLDVENFSVNYYVVENDKVEIFESVSNLSISAYDSLFINTSKLMQILDTINSKVEIVFDLDEDFGNNILYRKIIPGFNKNTVLINEIMFKPSNGEVEWVEIINNTDSTVNIKNWLFADSKNVSIITEEDLTIKSKQYLVISDFGSNMLSRSDIRTIEIEFPNLSNTKDEVIIYDFRKAVIDSLSYSVSNSFNSGNSLERVSLIVESTDQSNWTFSLNSNGSTPGVENSISVLPNNNFGDIIISEIMFNPSEENSEFVELFNNSSGDIEVGGWKFGTAEGENIVIIPQSFTLSSNDYLIIADDSLIYNNYSWLDSNNTSILEWESLSLTNSGKEIYLKDVRNNIIDSIYYSESLHNSALLETKNISLELINTNLARTDNKNWSSSVSEFGATPGRPNSINIDNSITKAKLNVTPNPFSPDNDGFEDFTFINYNLTEPISQIRTRIYDSKGRLVRSLINNQLSGQTGTIIFDGLDEQKKPLKMGIYIILFEAVNGNNSTVEVIKDVVVVARKL